MKSLWLLFAKSPVRAWVWLFLGINFFVTISGSVNPGARWATMVAMVEDKDFAIDRYLWVTCDWAKPPGGRYYSNKAPGPSLLGYPLFRWLDSMDTQNLRTRADRDRRRAARCDSNLHTLSMVLQVFPLAIVTLLLIEECRKLRLPSAGLHLAAVAILFGNTASLFANTYFGHTFSAAMVLFTLFALHRRMAAWTGLFFGLAVLADYSCIFLGLPLVAAFIMTGQFNWRKVLRIAVGGSVPLVVLGLYHKYCFGSAFTMAHKYVNPAFVDVKSEPALWGVIRILPNMRNLEKLLFSPERGVAYTQGWVLVCIAVVLVLVATRWADYAQRHMLRWVSAFCISGFILILWMNSSFGGWHGGATCGPRYLSAILPAFAITIPLLYPRVPAWIRELLVVSTVPALVLYVLVLGTKNVLAPESPLHEYYFNNLFRGQPGGDLANVAAILLAGAWAGYRAYRDCLLDTQQPKFE